MNDSVLNAKPVKLSDRLNFKCTRCSACCRHVRQSVPLECLDIFRMTKYFRYRDPSIKCTDDFLARYAEPALLDECGFFVFMLNVQGQDDACVFLQGNRCSVQDVKPRTCRLYPFVARPAENRRFEYLVSLEQPHHFSGPQISVKRWITRFFYAEEKEALCLDYQSVPGIARWMRRVPEENKKRAVSLFLWYRHSAYDLGRPFLEQFSVNMKKLQTALQALAAEKQNTSVTR